MIWVKLAHQSLTISGDSGYGGESIGIFSAVDTSENVIFSGAGKTHNHDSVWVYGTNAVGSTDSGLTITSTGAANFADYGNGGLHNPLSSITFAHSASGDTAFTGINWGSGGTVETTDASAFTGALTLGGVATGTASSAPPGPLVTATEFGDSGSGAPTGDTVKLGSGTTYFSENIVFDGAGGDNFTLLAGHTATDTLDSSATSSWLWNNAVTYTSEANDVLAMSTVTNFNLGNNTVGSGDVLKMGYGIPEEAVGTFNDIGTNGLVNGHQYVNVGTGTGIVSAAGVP
jgi:hypothetical protein